MDKFTLLLFFFSCSWCALIQAQESTTTYYLDFDGSIDTVGCNPFLEERNALSDDAKKFKVSHGSPEFYSAFKVKLEGDGSNDSEGLFTNDYKFKKGYVYRVYLQGYQDINRPTSYKMFIANGVKETQDTVCEPDSPAQYDNRVLVLTDSLFNYEGAVNKWSIKFSPTRKYS